MYSSPSCYQHGVMLLSVINVSLSALFLVVTTLLRLFLSSYDSKKGNITCLGGVGEQECCQLGGISKDVVQLDEGFVLNLRTLLPQGELEGLSSLYQVIIYYDSPVIVRRGKVYFHIIGQDS